MHQLHILGHCLSLSLYSAGFKLHHQNYPEKCWVKHYFKYLIAFEIRKNLLNGQTVSPSYFDMHKKNVIFVWVIHVFSIPIYKLKVVEKTPNFWLKLGFIAFSLSIFRITLKTSSVFRLSISSFSFDWEICSLCQRSTCLYDFNVKVSENQIDATFIAFGIYLKTSN